MTFFQFMNLSLYHAEHGYYAQTPRQVGRSGDFFTSVSCGPLFGILLAEKIAHWWREADVHGPWRIIEPGPNNAALAIDILEHLSEHHADVFSQLTYVTIDPLAVPRAYQQKALARFADRVLCLEDALSLHPLPTYVVANEVLDAFPCSLIEFRGDAWQEIWIESIGEGMDLKEMWRPFSGSLPLSLRDRAYAEGYRTEIRAAPREFLHDLQKAMSYGRMLFLDYGFAEPEYYDPQRIRGTLRTYQNHQASENALSHPGEMDITAHVDFTSIMRCARELGMNLAGFMPQEFMLSRIMTGLLSRQSWKPEWQRNFQTLVHPAHLGAKFHALELSWHESLNDDATGMHRLAMDHPPFGT
jgi:SAM-dependent MidA family methyltransferase